MHVHDKLTGHFAELNLILIQRVSPVRIIGIIDRLDLIFYIFCTELCLNGHFLTGLHHRYSRMLRIAIYQQVSHKIDRLGDFNIFLQPYSIQIAAGFQSFFFNRFFLGSKRHHPAAALEYSSGGLHRADPVKELRTGGRRRVVLDRRQLDARLIHAEDGAVRIQEMDRIVPEPGVFTSPAKECVLHAVLSDRLSERIRRKLHCLSISRIDSNFFIIFLTDTVMQCQYDLFFAVRHKAPLSREINIAAVQDHTVGRNILQL